MHLTPAEGFHTALEGHNVLIGNLVEAVTNLETVLVKKKKDEK